jgi:hypothetical protein
VTHAGDIKSRVKEISLKYSDSRKRNQDLVNYSELRPERSGENWDDKNKKQGLRE